MNKRVNLIVSLVALLLAISILMLMIFAENLQAQSVLQDKVYYVCLVLMGIFSGISLFNYLKSHAQVSGHAHGWGVEVGGPAALVVLVVFGGFFLIPRLESFDLTVRAINEKGNLAYSNRKAQFTIMLPTGQRTGYFTAEGEGTIKGLPAKLFNTKAKIQVSIYFYDQIEKDQEYILNNDVVEIQVKSNANGTPESILNRRRANLEVVKLLMPYRLIYMEEKKYGETNITQYQDKLFLDRANALNINSVISISPDEIDDTFDVLRENAPEALNVNGKTYAELIHETAINFRRNVGIMSQIDSEGIDPEIQRELIIISRAQFVIIAAGINPKDSGGYINSGFWASLASETARIYESNKINLFVEFSDF